ncbi:MAG: CBS domain-containing protein [Chloroflexi bacterium]|nr:CBS domain-containing protein [Chloroflexota bacterium]
MPNTVNDYMSSPVIAVAPDDSVSNAVTIMRRRNIHSIVVKPEAPGGAHGIVTSTDIRDKIAGQERDPRSVKVKEIMTSPIVTARPEWTIKECSVKMQALRVHHLPVADESGELIGMISDTDIFVAVEEAGWSGE